MGRNKSFFRKFKRFLLVIEALIFAAVFVIQTQAESSAYTRNNNSFATWQTSEISQQEEESTESPEEETSEAEEETPEEAPEYTVTDLSEVRYANQLSNVRCGPSTDYDRIGSLAQNQEVQVTGQASTGWYRISYNGGEGFVSHILLDTTPVEVPQPEPQPEPEPQPQPEQPAQPQPEPQPKELWEYTEDELVYGIVNAIITPDMDAFQRATVINNYLCATMSYDYTYSHRSTFDALAYGTGVCQGYANAFCRLMNAAGVETDFISGYGWTGSEWGSHGWNRSLINGVYYYTDATWNDSLGSNQYLLISFEEMERDHRQQKINPNRIK